MIKYDIKNIKQMHLFRSMYNAYLKDLSQYSKRLRMEPITQDEIYKIDTNPLLERYFLTDPNNSPIGFVLLGFKENTQPGTDWFIAEFYIQPSARRQGNGRKAFKEILETHPGAFCYFVLQQNIPAQHFWNKLKEEFRCENITKCYNCLHTPEDCFFEAFWNPIPPFKKEGNKENETFTN